LVDTWNANLCNMNQAHISSSLIFIVTITILTGEKLNNCSNLNGTSLQYYVIPVHYHIKLNHYFWEKYDLNFKNKYTIFNFDGESYITINILQSTQYIKLHKLNLIIIHEEITLIKNNGNIINYAPEKYTETLKTNLSNFRFSGILSPGLYTLKIEFVARFAEDSANNFFKSFYTNKENGLV